MIDLIFRLLSDIILVYVFFYFIIKKRDLKIIIPLVVSYFLKILFGIKREVCGLYRYPSTHATIFGYSYNYFNDYKIKLLLILGSIFRVFGNCHKIVDVIFGFLLGYYINLVMNNFNFDYFYRIMKDSILRKIVHISVSILAIIFYIYKIEFGYLIFLFLTLILLVSIKLKIKLLELVSKPNEKYYIGPISLFITYFLLLYFNVDSKVFIIFAITIGILDPLSHILLKLISSEKKSYIVILLTPFFVYPYVKNLFLIIYLIFLTIEILTIEVKFKNFKLDDNFLYLLVIIFYILIKKLS